MDPLSVAASVIAVVSLVDRLTVIASAFRQAGKAAPSELAELSTEISTLRIILQRLQETDAAQAADGRKPGHTNDLQATLQNCNDAVRAARHKVRAVEKLLRGETIDRVNFAFSSTSFRQDFKDLLARLERSKTSLLLSLQLINMDGWKDALEAMSSTAIAGSNTAISAIASGEDQNHSTDVAGPATPVQIEPSMSLDQTHNASPFSQPSPGSGNELVMHGSIGGWLGTFRPKAPPER